MAACPRAGADHTVDVTRATHIRRRTCPVLLYGTAVAATLEIKERPIRIETEADLAYRFHAAFSDERVLGNDVDVAKVPLERLIGSAVVIDVTSKAEPNADYQVSTGDLQEWEKLHGVIPGNTILLLRTGFSARWPDATRYLGTAERGEGAVAKLHFPGLHPDAAKWIVASRPIKAIGIDTASIDYGQSTLYESHRILYARNIPAFENLASLDRLPPTGANIVALPMKIKGGSGAPLRVIAIVPR